jgi:preprotein translocase subunit SecF
MRIFKFIENSKFDFIGHRFIAFFVTGIMIVGSLALFGTKGLNYGIDFSGGVMMEIRVPAAPDLGKLRAQLNNLELGSVSLQEFGQPTDLMIRIPEQEGGNEAQQAAINKVRVVLDENFGEGKVDYRRNEFVGPQVGEELKIKGLLAFALTIAGILGYVWYRFEWQFGVSAIVCLIHDTLAVAGYYSLLGLQFDLAALACVLMVAGYSTNDTVIVFDRIRENRRKYKKMPMQELLNLSVNQTLSRTLMTSLTTLLALVALFVFGGEVIRDFVEAMIFGIVVGTYSSIYVASSLLLYLPFSDDWKRADHGPQSEETAEVAS